MNLLYIGIIALAIIGVGCMYFRVDGALLGTIITLVAGAAGFGVQKAKENIAPSGVKLLIPLANIDTGKVDLVNYTVPTKSPKLDDKVTIDFVEVDNRLKQSIKELGITDNPETEAAIAMNMAGGAKVTNLDEVIQWNSYLMDKAIKAVASLFNISKPKDKADLDNWVQQYKSIGCHPITDAQNVALSWVERLEGHQKALSRLAVVGLDWGKLINSYKTAWYIAELAYNPVVQIGITSEDTVV